MNRIAVNLGEVPLKLNVDYGLETLDYRNILGTPSRQGWTMAF